MARNINGTNLKSHEIERAIWFDIEKQMADKQPSVTGLLVDGEFSITVHDSRLQLGAKYSNLSYQPAYDFYDELIQRCQLEKRLLISYTKADFDFVLESNPGLSTRMKEVYQKAKFTSFFKYKHPELYNEMQNALSRRYKNRRNRYMVMKKQNGEFVIGLKDMLKLDAVGYPDLKKVGIGGSATAISKIRRRFEKTGYDLDALTTGEKKAWSKMLNYLKHDVYGLQHLTKWVNSQ